MRACRSAEPFSPFVPSFLPSFPGPNDLARRGDDSPKFDGYGDDNTCAVAAPKCTRVGCSVGGHCVGIGPSASTGEPLGRCGSF